MSKILITGAKSGLGAAMATLLERDGHEVIRFDRADGFDVRTPPPDLSEQLDGELDVLINNAGVNRINWLADVSHAEWSEVMDTNAMGIFKMTQACLPALRAAGGTVLNIVSNAAHMPMRCSLAYNASKGAALIMTKQLARELAADGITVFSVSPNRLRGTAMSDEIDRRVTVTRGWSAEEARKYQLSSLLAGEETDPACVAEFIAFLLSRKDRHKYLAGCDIPYGA